MCSKLQNETVRKKYHSYDVIFDGIRDELKKVIMYVVTLRLQLLEKIWGIPKPWILLIRRTVFCRL